MAYTCDIKQVVTINFDRKMVRNTAAELDRRADLVSTEIDQCTVNSSVDYAAPFLANNTFDEVFGVYMDLQN